MTAGSLRAHCEFTTARLEIFEGTLGECLKRFGELLGGCLGVGPEQRRRICRRLSEARNPGCALNVFDGTAEIRSGTDYGKMWPVTVPEPWLRPPIWCVCWVLPGLDYRVRVCGEQTVHNREIGIRFGALPGLGRSLSLGGWCNRSGLVGVVLGCASMRQGPRPLRENISAGELGKYFANPQTEPCVRAMTWKGADQPHFME